MKMLPGNIYFDTSILKSLHFDIMNDTRFNDLKNTRLKALKIKTFIPRIVLDELTKLREEEFMSELNSLEEKIGKFNRYLSANKIASIMDNREVLITEFLSNLNNNIRKAELEVFENNLNQVNIEEIIKKAVGNEKPFSREDKGFKDFMILCSVIEHCKSDLDREHIFFTSNRNDFDSDAVIKFIASKKTNLKMIFLWEDLSKYLNGFLNDVVKEWIDSRRRKIQEFIEGERQRIQDFVDKSSYRTELLNVVGNIEKITSIEIIGIERPFVDFLDNVEQGDVNISFNLKLKFNLLITRYDFANPPIRIGEVKSMSTVPSLFRGPAASEKTLAVTGKVYAKTLESGEEEYSNLRLEEIREPYDSLFQLALESAIKGQGE